VVDESVLRLMQSRDSKRENPRYDVYTIGFLEALLWGKNGRLAPVPYTILSTVEGTDWIPEFMDGFRHGDHYYALPFNGESSMTYHRRDVFDRYNLTMPAAPSWTQIESLLAELTSGSNGRAGGSIATVDIYPHVGYTRAPSEVTDQGTNWLWSWGFAVPSGSQAQEAAWRFVQWATSNDYHQLVEEHYGIAQVPPGTRRSLYRNSAYQLYARFADSTIEAIRTSDFDQPSAQPVPYRGIQFVQTEEFQQIGNYVGKILAGLLQSRLTNQGLDIPRELERASDFVRASHNVGDYLREHDIDAF